MLDGSLFTLFKSGLLASICFSFSLPLQSRLLLAVVLFARQQDLWIRIGLAKSNSHLYAGPGLRNNSSFRVCRANGSSHNRHATFQQRYIERFALINELPLPPWLFEPTSRETLAAGTRREIPRSRTYNRGRGRPQETGVPGIYGRRCSLEFILALQNRGIRGLGLLYL
jgi:hypothetical protein